MTTNCSVQFIGQKVSLRRKREYSARTHIAHARPYAYIELQSSDAQISPTTLFNQLFLPLWWGFGCFLWWSTSRDWKRWQLRVFVQCGKWVAYQFSFVHTVCCAFFCVGRSISFLCNIQAGPTTVFWQPSHFVLLRFSTCFLYSSTKAKRGQTWVLYLSSVLRYSKHHEEKGRQNDWWTVAHTYRVVSMGCCYKEKCFFPDCKFDFWKMFQDSFFRNVRYIHTGWTTERVSHGHFSSGKEHSEFNI